MPNFNPMSIVPAAVVVERSESCGYHYDHAELHCNSCWSSSIDETKLILQHEFFWIDTKQVEKGLGVASEFSSTVIPFDDMIHHAEENYEEDKTFFTDNAHVSVRWRAETHEFVLSGPYLHSLFKLGDLKYTIEELEGVLGKGFFSSHDDTGAI